MSRKKNHLSRKKIRYRRIRRFMVFLLILLLAAFAGISLQQKKETDAQKAQAQREEKEKQAARKAEKAGEEKASSEAKAAEEEQKKAEEAAKAAAEATINKDVQTAQNTASDDSHKTNGLAICMYHYVYDKDNPPKEKLNSNFIEVHDLEEELKYLTENNYYFPTWEEVEKFVTGDYLLPEKSVVLTFDDGAYSFLNLGVPLFEKYKVPVTSFLIGNIEGEKKVKKYASEYMTFQSHSYNMHRGGGNIGHGGIFPVMNHDDAVADLQKSIEIGGNGDAFAYPYGDYNDSCVKAVKDAGFKCAVTTEYGRAKPGDDPLLLPRIRMSMGQSLESFKKLVE